MAILNIFPILNPTAGNVAAIRVDYDTLAGSYNVYYRKVNTRSTRAPDISWYLTNVADPAITGVVLENRTGLLSESVACIAFNINNFRWKAAFPYAETVPTTTPCGGASVPPNPIIFSHEITPQQNVGEPDGAVVFAVTPHRPIKIRINSYGFDPTAANYGYDKSQTDNPVFTGLYPGTYFVSAEAFDPFSPGTLIATQPWDYFVIPVASPAIYNLYAFGGLESVRGKLWRIEIRKRGFIGIPREFCLMDNFLRLYSRGTVHEGLYSNVNGLSVDFTIAARSLRDFADIFTNDDREFLVEVTRNTEIRFRGYLIPDISSQQHEKYLHPAYFTATDGMGTLKDMPFATNTGKQYTGRRTITEIVGLCLQKASLFFPIEWNVPVRPDGNTDPLFFDTAEMDVSVFYRIKPDCTCFEVLTHVLEIFSARISQTGGVFLIDQPYTLDNSETFSTGIATRSRYSNSDCTVNVTLAKESSIEMYAAVQGIEMVAAMHPQALALLDFSQASEWIRDGEISRGVARYKPANMVQSFPPAKISWLPGYVGKRVNTGARTSIGTDAINVSGTGAYANRPRRGSKTNPESPDIFTGMHFSVVPLFQLGVPAEASKPGLTYISHPLFHDFNGSLFIGLRFSQMAIPANVNAEFSIAWAGWHLSPSGQQWMDTPQQMRYVFTAAEMGKDITVSFQTPPLPMPPDIAVGYPVTVSVMQPWRDKVAGESTFLFGNTVPDALMNENSYAFKQLDVRLLINGGELQTEKRHIFTNAGRYNSPAVEVRRELGGWQEGMDTDNVEYSYPYVIFTAGKPVLRWRDADGLLSANLSDIAFRILVEARRTNREKLNANIRGDHEFYRLLRILPDSGRVYFCNSLETDPFRDRVSGEFVLCGQSLPMPVYRLLEDGRLHLKEGAIEKGSFHEDITYA